jgi:hypothetical protein
MTRRCLRTFRIAGVLLASLAAADDTSVAPRPKPTDYPAHDSVKTAVLAAAMVPPEQVKKIFSAETAKQYIVVEVAVYPEDGHSMDIDLLDFELKAGDQFVRASEPRDIGLTTWPSAKDPSIGSRGPNVTAETGVIVAHETDPLTGRPRTSVGTYEGVAVSNYPRPDPPPAPPRNNPNQSDTEDKMRRLALPEGPAKSRMAGYMYFRHQRRKQDSFTLNYSNDDLSVDLKFPK